MAIYVPIISSFDGKGITKALRDFKKLETGSDKAAFSLLNANAAVTKGVASFAKYGGIAAGVVGVIGGKLVSAAYESQKVMKQTEAIIAATGSAAGLTAKQVSDLATKMSLKTGIDDEAIQTSMNLLLTFKQVRNEMGKGNDIFNRASMAALDLGNVFGSTDAAAKMLGKALSDPVKGVSALARAGVNFSQQQKEQIRTLVASGKTLEAQKLILAEVESQVGGTAAASATAFDKMKVAVGNVQEELGMLLLPAVEKLSTYISDKVVPVFQNFSDIVGKDGVGAGVNYLIGSLVNGISSMGLFGKTILAVTGFITALKVATVTYRSAMVATNVVLALSDGALKALILRLGQVKIAMLAAGGVTALISLAAVVYAKYASDKSKAEQATKDFTDALLLEGVAQGDAFKELTKSNSQFRIMVGSLGDVGLSMNDVNQFVATGTGKFAKYVSALDTVSASGKVGVQALDAFAAAVGLAAGAQSSAGGELAFGLSEFAALAKGLRGDQVATNAAVALLGKIGINAFGGAGGAAQTAADKFKKYVTAIRNYSSEQKGYTSSLKSTAKAQQDLVTATDNVTKAQERYDKVVRGYGAGSEQATTAQEELNQAQRDATRAGINSTRAANAVIAAQTELDKARRRGNPTEIAEAEATLTEAQLDAEEKLIALKEANDAVTTAQTKLNEALNGATTESQTYKDALTELNEAKAKEVEAADAVTEAIDREADAKFRLVQAEKELKDARSKTTKEQRAEAEKQTGINVSTITDKRKEFLAKINKELGTKFKSIATYIAGGSDAAGKASRKERFNKFARENNIPQLYKGGVVMQPTLALIGERAPEAVIPLSQLGKTSGGDTYITVTVTGADPNAVVDALRRYQRQNGALPLRVAG